jgi:hypothetical protein
MVNTKNIRKSKKRETMTDEIIKELTQAVGTLKKCL